LEFIVKHKKYFIAALKYNRLFATSLNNQYNDKFTILSALNLSDKQSIRSYINGYDKEVIIVRRIFTKKDGNTGILSLICSETNLDRGII
jgi:hypothetical protein